MFWRKKVSFRDWALRIILGDVFTGPQTTIEMGTAAVVESMKFGIAVGAQFPTKVMPIIRQVSGDGTENAYTQMKEYLQSWVDSKPGTVTVIDLKSFPLIAEPVENRRLDSLTPGIVFEWANYTFYYGLMMGSLHQELFLGSLEFSIRLDNLEWKLIEEYAPPDLKSGSESTYEGFLSDAREMVTVYEKEQGTLS